MRSSTSLTPGSVYADALDHRFPGLAEELSKSPGIGFVLARSDHGPVCFWRGQRYQLGEAEPGPFAGRADAALVLQGIADLMAMPSAGDLVIYGIDAPGGHVSFIPEVGAHAGPSPEELHTFIVCSAEAHSALADHSPGPALRALHAVSIRARGERMTTLFQQDGAPRLRRDVLGERLLSLLP